MLWRGGPLEHQAAINYKLSIRVYGRYLVACRQLHYFFAIPQEIAEPADHERAGSLLDKGRKGSFEIETAYLRYKDLSPQRTTRCEHRTLQFLGNRSVWNRKISNRGCLGDQLDQETEPLAG